MARLALFLSVLVVIPFAAHAQCDGPGWQVYDDGSYEGDGMPPTDPSTGSVGVFKAGGAMRQGDFIGNARVTDACVCFRREEGDAAPFVFDFGVWANDRETLLGIVEGVAVASVPSDPQGVTVPISLRTLDISVDEPYYIGALWDYTAYPDFRICTDESEETDEQIFTYFTSSAPVLPREFPDGGFFGPFSDYKAAGLRSRTEPDESICLPTATTLCLGEGGRFRVSATFDDGTRQDVAMARAFDDINDSGLFWFYSAGNLEMLVKILNGCPINDRFWVFFAATTDVGFELTVEDLESGTSKTYTNELGNRANAITDTDAFATCSP